MNRNIKLLEMTYLIILGVVLVLIIFTPYIIRSGFTFFEEQLSEAAFITLLFFVGFAIFLFYRKESIKNQNRLALLKQEKGTLESRLNDAFAYIGSVNIQINEIKSVFSDIRNFPETKKDFAYILRFLAEKALSMVNCDWVVLRIIDVGSLKTLRDYAQTRGNIIALKHKISNKDLATSKTSNEFTVIGSVQDNFCIRTFCILPPTQLSSDEKVFLQALVNQLEMLFFIFASNYYNNRNKNNRSAPGESILKNPLDTTGLDDHT